MAAAVAVADAAAVALKLPALDDGAACFAEAAAAGFQIESIDDYEMVEEIGEGTYGIVAKARDRRTGETVAVKWVRGGGDDATGDLFLVMEFAGPTTLRRHLSKRGPLTEAEIRASMRQVSHGMA